jgi:hypothetical protein
MRGLLMRMRLWSLSALAVVSLTGLQAQEPAGLAPPPFCKDILTIPRRSLLLGWKLRDDRFVLLDGARVCASDEPYEDTTKVCDWEYELTDTAVLTPEPATVLRLVTTARTHLTGTGMSIETNALECRRNVLREVFSTSLGFKRQLSSTVFLAAGRLWLKDDAHCCPSHERELRYQWDKVGHTYIADGETYFKIDETTRKRTRVPKPADAVNW